jgi:phosphatidylinositol alpha 1,6-mannosyltransferase
MNYSDLKVAYFAGTMKPGHDGVTRVLYKLIDSLNVYGIDNIFFSPIIPLPGEQPTEMYKVPSVTFPFYKDYRLAVGNHKTFEKQIEKFNPNLIHINSPCPLGYAALRYGLKCKIPVAATYHTHFSSYAKYYKIKALETAGWNYFRSLYNKCDIVYVPSIPILEELKKQGIHKLKLIPHGVDIKTFNPSFYSTTFRKDINPGNKTILLFAGRLVWEKDLLILAQSYKILKQRRNDFIIVLAGDGPIKKELKQLIPDAVFLGHVSGHKLSTVYASSDILVFPSTTETFGNVILEAMASGVAPVCVKEGGAYGVIDDGVNGLIANPRDAKDFADKIEYLIDNPSYRKRIRDNSFLFAQEQGWDKIFYKLFESYIEVIENYSLKRNAKKRFYIKCHTNSRVI